MTRGEKRRKGWSEEARARQSAVIKARMADPALRAKISKQVKAAMADPQVRQRISDRTREGLKNALVSTPDTAARRKAGNDRYVAATRAGMADLLSAWAAANKTARAAFLSKVFAAVSSASVSKDDTDAS